MSTTEGLTKTDLVLTEGQVVTVHLGEIACRATVLDPAHMVRTRRIQEVTNILLGPYWHLRVEMPGGRVTDLDVEPGCAWVEVPGEEPVTSEGLSTLQLAELTCPECARVGDDCGCDLRVGCLAREVCGDVDPMSAAYGFPATGLILCSLCEVVGTPEDGLREVCDRLTETEAQEVLLGLYARRQNCQRRLDAARARLVRDFPGTTDMERRVVAQQVRWYAYCALTEATERETVVRVYLGHRLPELLRDGRGG